MDALPYGRPTPRPSPLSGRRGNDAPGGTSRGGPRPPPGPRRARRRRAECRRSCAGSGARRRRRRHRGGEAHEGVHVGAVHVHLPAVGVDDVAKLRDASLEDTVRGGVGHHDRGKVLRVLRRLGRRSARSTLPLSSQATTTTCMPAMCAEAGLVPWAELGMRQMSRCPSRGSRARP